MSGTLALVTGFGAFPGVEDNPSRRIVEALAQRPAPVAGVDLLTALLPVDYEAVGPAVLRLLAEHRPAALVLTGVRSSGGDEVGIERVALNLDDAATPDNAGVRRAGTPIVTDGPPAYISPLDLDALRIPFLARGARAAVSNHAGAYLCNRAYYLACHGIGAARLTTRCVFVHVPWITGRAVARTDGTPLDVATLAPAVAECAARLAAGG